MASRISLLKKLDRWVGPLLTRVFPALPSAQLSPAGMARVLFIRPGGIGDAVLLVPAIAAVKSAYPGVVIDVLAEKRNASVFKLCSPVKDIACYDQPVELWRVLRRSYDVIIDTEQWHRLSAVVARLIKGTHRFGFATNDRARLFTKEVVYSHADYEADSFLHLIAPLHQSPEVDFSAPWLQIPDGVRPLVELVGGDAGQYVVLFPGASIAEKCWGAKKFANLAERLVSAGYDIVVVGGKGELGEAELVARVASVVNLAGKTSLLETAAILSGAALLVSGDSGVLHLGVGLGVPTVSLFGPSNVQKWAPRGERHRVVNLDLACSPCSEYGYTPPCPDSVRCIKGIAVDEVFSAVRQLLTLG